MTLYFLFGTFLLLEGRKAMNAPAGAVLIGIGNSLRRDDGVGPALVDAVSELELPGVSAIVSDGEPSHLLDAWSGARLAVIVDAVRCKVPISDDAVTSSHR